MEAMRLQIARTRSEELQCLDLIAEVYNKAYGVRFSDDSYDLDAKVERLPDRFLMGLVNGELVASAGLYTRNTYVERFGDVRDAEIDALLREAGAAVRFSSARKREITKIAVRPGRRGRDYGRILIAGTFSRSFLQDGTLTEEPALLVSCAKRAIWRIVHSLGIRTRLLKIFPTYKVHEHYCSPQDTMDSRLMVPDIDIPQRLYDRLLPDDYPLASEARTSCLISAG